MASVPAAERLNRYVGDPWSRQPEETARQFARFTMFLGLGRGDRTYTAVAQEYHLQESSVREVAERWRWNERANLRDADLNQRALAQIAEKETQLRKRAINLALVGASLMGRTLGKLADDPKFVLDAKDMPQWAKMVETLRKVALDAPDATIGVTGGAGPAEAAALVPDFSGLSPAQIADRAEDMARSMLRLLPGGKRAV